MTSSICCSAPPAGEVTPFQCRVCGQKARRVKRSTMESLLEEVALARLEDHSYYFCATPACPIVYFSNEACSSFHKDDLKVRVGLKESQDPIPICYCFGFTEKMVLDEIRARGNSTIPDRIREEVKAGNCACEVKNPSGNCCLGVVTQVLVKGLNGRIRGVGAGAQEPVETASPACGA